MSESATGWAIARYPAGWRSDMTPTTSSRSSAGAFSDSSPGNQPGTQSSGGSRDSRRQLARRSSQTASGNEPLQPA